MSISEACARSRAAQRYAIPSGVGRKNNSGVIIWCERYGVLISPADLMPAAGR